MKNLILISFMLMLIISCTDTEYQRNISEWKKERLERLKSKTGWLNLAGLYWLTEGENSLGSDTSNTIVFPENAPKNFGQIIKEGDSILYIAPKNSNIRVNDLQFDSIYLHNDQEGKPELIKGGDFGWFIIKRSEKYGIRLRWYKHPNIDSLHAIPSFKVRKKWKIKADFIPFDTAKIILVGNMIGGTEEIKCPGELEFRIGLKKHQLYPGKAGDGLFIIFGDKTSGKSSYPSGRFLYIMEPDENNEVIIDFNKAYNPPCAFTPYATCPLPPRENILDLKVTAGEMEVHL